MVLKHFVKSCIRRCLDSLIQKTAHVQVHVGHVWDFPRARGNLLKISGTVLWSYQTVRVNNYQHHFKPYSRYICHRMTILGI